jgi:hypothetical protein
MPEQGREKVRIGDITLQGPVPNQKCPACANSNAIFKEIVTFPYTLNDALSDHAFGVSPWWGLLIPRRRTRMRCSICNCQFPGRWPGWARFLAWGLTLSVLGLGNLWAYRQWPQLWPMLRAWWQSDPLVVLVVGGVAGTALVVILVVAAYPRRKPGKWPQSSAISKTPPPAP